jgi:thiamine-monophosphate kinase
MNDLQPRRFAEFYLQFLLRSCDRKHLVIKKFFYAERYLYVLSTIASLARTILLRGQHRKLGFPVSEHVRLHADKVTDLADLEIDFLRYYYSRASHSVKFVLKFYISAVAVIVCIYYGCVNRFLMLSEFDFIQNIKKKYALNRVGDDCAVLPKDAESDLLVTADMLVEDIDFRLAWTTPEFLGHKALAVSLSDVAAMSGTPEWAMLSVGVPEKLWKTDFLNKFYVGWHSLARQFGVELIGGDVSRSPDKFLVDSIVGGSVEKGKAILRSTARPGDSIFVSGFLGGAAGGLKLLESGHRHDRVDDSPGRLIERLLKPNPQLKLAASLQDIASAMIDISDGFSSDLAHICNESGVGAIIENVPVDPNLFENFNDEMIAFEFAETGGEDFELLFTVPHEKIFELEKLPVTRVGVITPNAGKIELIRGEVKTDLEPKGYRHF